MTLDAWLQERRRPVPAAFMPSLDASGPATVDRCTELAVAALDAAQRGDPSDRASAFSLLAADGWLTYACLLALEEQAPQEALSRVLGGIAVEGS